MGVITIRQSTAQLVNLGATPVRQVHTPNYHINRRTGEADAIASQQHIARGMQDFGKAVLNVALALKRDQTNIALNEAEAEYEKAVRDRMMDPKSGFLAMNLDNSGAIESFAKDSSKMLDDVRDEIAKKHELSGGTREAFNNRTQGVYSGWSRQIAGRTLQAHDTLKKNAAANLTEQKYQDWLLNPVDIDSTKELVDSFRAQCYTNGDDDQAAAMNVDKYCRGLAFDYATHTFKSIQDEKGVEAAIEQLEKNPASLISGNSALSSYFIPRDDETIKNLTRPDGSMKGTGWLGKLGLKGGGFATEYSMQSDAVRGADGKRIDFPSLVPGLTDAQIKVMTDDVIPNKKPVPDDIAQIAVDHALKMQKEGKSVWANSNTLFSPFDEKGLRALRGSLETRRREIHARDERRVDEAANVGIIAVAAIRDKDGKYPQDRLPTIEHAITHLQDLTVALPKGSRAAALAATQASDLNAKADMIAQQEMIDEYLNELKTNPKAKIYAPETKNEKGDVSPARNAYIGSGRKERLAPMVQQMVDQQRQSGSDAQARKANFANWKLKMLNGAKNPGEYHNEIFKAAEKGELTLDEYMKLKSEFDSSWAQGFVPGQKSPKQLAAEGMLGVVQEFFPNEELAASYEWDSKIGGLKMKKDAKYSGLEYEIHDRGGFWRGLGDLYEFPATSTTHKMGPDMVEKIVNVATALSFYDGQQIDFDPITGKDVDFFTGEKIKTGKDAPKFSATNYFKQYLGRLKDEYKAIEAAEYVMQLVEAERNISGSFTDLEDARRTAIGNAAKDAEKKSVTIRNRKTGEGVTTKK